jgi:hypothetical protein
MAVSAGKAEEGDSHRGPNPPDSLVGRAPPNVSQLDEALRAARTGLCDAAVEWERRNDGRGLDVDELSLDDLWKRAHNVADLVADANTKLLLRGRLRGSISATDTESAGLLRFFDSHRDFSDVYAALMTLVRAQRRHDARREVLQNCEGPDEIMASRRVFLSHNSLDKQNWALTCRSVLLKQRGMSGDRAPWLFFDSNVDREISLSTQLRACLCSEQFQHCVVILTESYLCKAWPMLAPT